MQEAIIFSGNAALLARVCGVSKFDFVLMIITLFSFSSVPHCVKSCPIFCVANGLNLVDLKLKNWKIGKLKN